MKSCYSPPLPPLFTRSLAGRYPAQLYKANCPGSSRRTAAEYRCGTRVCRTLPLKRPTNDPPSPTPHLYLSQVQTLAVVTVALAASTAHDPISLLLEYEASAGRGGGGGEHEIVTTLCLCLSLCTLSLTGGFR